MDMNTEKYTNIVMAEHLNDYAKNIILYGPPGTGKTYNTVIKAMEIVTFRELFSYWFLNERKKDAADKTLNDYIVHIEKISSEFNINIFKYHNKDEYSKLKDKILKSDYITKNDSRNYSGSYYKHCLKRYEEFLDWLTYDKILKAFNNEIKKDNGRIRFVTFHQSFSYEEFVEGIKPEIKNWGDEGQDVKYIGKDGVFKDICKQAQKIVVSSDKKVEDINFSKVNIFKMSLYSNTEDVYGYCLENNVIALGWGGDKDYSKCKNLESIKKLKGSDEGARELNCFVNKIAEGDIVIISCGNNNFKAIARVKGNYFYNPNTEIGFSQFREVEWLYHGNNIPTNKIYNSSFSMPACYMLYRNRVNTNVLNQIITGKEKCAKISFDNLLNRFKEKHPEGSILETSSRNAKFEISVYTDNCIKIMLNSKNKTTYSLSMSDISRHLSLNNVKSVKDLKDNVDKKDKKSLSSYYFAIHQEFKQIEKELIGMQNNNEDYVLVIDEINRGNISKIFGELITLIEEDKREKLSAILPYSQEVFTVPKNLYIVGTMNTSDRSIASIDIALRRRFKFEEMYPCSLLVVDTFNGCDDFSFRNIFENLNSCIEVLLDKDHQIGHSYFMKNKIKTIEDLKDVWFKNILPLLNEYFYCDWEKLNLIIPGFIERKNVQKCFKDYVDNIYCFKNKDDFKDIKSFIDALKSIKNPFEEEKKTSEV